MELPLLLRADAEYHVAPWLADHDTTACLLAQSITTETPVGMHGADRRKDRVRTLRFLLFNCKLSNYMFLLFFPFGTYLVSQCMLHV